MIGNMNHTTVKLELMMKRIILFVLLAISATATIAQTNPKPGYIITNSGDLVAILLLFLQCLIAHGDCPRVREMLGKKLGGLK